MATGEDSAGEARAALTVVALGGTGSGSGGAGGDLASTGSGIPVAALVAAAAMLTVAGALLVRRRRAGSEV